MSFFRGSFSSIGEALKTISLAIAVLGAMLSGISYVYGTLSAQSAMASDLSKLNERVMVMEEAGKDAKLWMYRVEQTEIGVSAANQKLDRVESALQDLRVVIEGKRASK
ncbi:hypothetical protein KEU06_09595 [Pseudaminobacter sp. 19-2017]|uniref:Uncharacterized protein n=1 Tax=Pseudaminobacter soli (ex Zhang et al. 2022) TaxID=2831468 RepID=A0A942I2T4_9HYPH|nr:hypothetical protein [Pseudaminobacter soli]MBS3648859.1 hypothetical protein [Pseudaminobacter soli]